MIDKRIRVNQIAQAADVSPATVSRVINHPETVTEETKTLVFNAMTKLGMDGVSEIIKNSTYSKSVSRDVKKGLIILNVPELDNPFLSDVFKGIEASATSHGYSVLLHVGIIYKDKLQEFLSLVKMTGARGVITMCTNSETVIKSLDENSIPFVQCCEYCETYPASYVGFNDHTAAKRATEYIISTGHRKIGFINTVLAYRFARHRYQGFCEAIEEANISVPSNWVTNLPNVSYDAAYAAMTQLLSKDNIPNAILAVSDVCAVATMNAARNYHLRIPEDLVVVGFDDVTIARSAYPALTTVSLPRYQVGYTSGEMLFEKIDQPDEPNRNILFDAMLVIRGSTENTSEKTIVNLNK